VHSLRICFLLIIASFIFDSYITFLFKEIFICLIGSTFLLEENSLVILEVLLNLGSLGKELAIAVTENKSSSHVFDIFVVLSNLFCKLFVDALELILSLDQSSDPSLGLIQFSNILLRRTLTVLNLDSNKLLGIMLFEYDFMLFDNRGSGCCGGSVDLGVLFSFLYNLLNLLNNLLHWLLLDWLVFDVFFLWWFSSLPGKLETELTSVLAVGLKWPPAF